MSIETIRGVDEEASDFVEAGVAEGAGDAVTAVDAAATWDAVLAVLQAELTRATDSAIAMPNQARDAVRDDWAIASSSMWILQSMNEASPAIA